MDRLLARLERRLGRFAIERLTLYIVGGMAIVFVMSLAKPDFVTRLHLDWELVKRGQVWRLVTYLFIPEGDRWWILLQLYFLWLIGSNLENEWGAFKFNAFYFLGMLGTTVAAAIVGVAGNTWLNMTLFLAFATLFPDYEILLFFIVPIRVKWLALVSAGFLVYSAVVGGWPTRAAILAGVANYLVFFAGHLLGLMKDRSLQVKQAARRASMRPQASSSPNLGRRSCAICGRREEDGADIRVCSCEKCGGQPRTLCLEHARNH
jgi:membrane associated rhomboid family serine protease